MTSLPDGIEIRGEIASGFDQILTPDALALVAKLQRELGKRRIECLKRRQERQARLDAGESLDFLSETKHIRDGDWTCASIPADLQDRRVEITGPTDRKMAINALNSGARMFMADFEDANSPTWSNMVDGEAVSASLFDFELYLFHNGRRLLDKGTGPYLYLPKLESHLEARLWNDVFTHGEEALGLPQGLIK